MSEAILPFIPKNDQTSSRVPLTINQRFSPGTSTVDVGKFSFIIVSMTNCMLGYPDPESSSSSWPGNPGDLMGPAITASDIGRTLSYKIPLTWFYGPHPGLGSQSFTITLNSKLTLNVNYDLSWNFDAAHAYIALSFLII